MPERAHPGRITARIVHALPGRVRLRFSGMTAADLRTMSDKIASLPKVKAALPDARTGSILVHGEDLEPDVFAEMGHDLGMALSRNPEIRSLVKHIGEGLAALDGRVKSVTGGRLDLPSLALITLLGGAAVQLLRGRFAAPGVTMLWYAANTILTAQLGRAPPPS